MDNTFTKIENNTTQKVTNLSKTLLSEVYTLSANSTNNLTAKAENVMNCAKFNQFTTATQNLIDLDSLKDTGNELVNYARNHPTKTTVGLFGLVPTAYAALALQAAFTPETFLAKTALTLGTGAAVEGSLFLLTKELNKQFNQ